MLLYVGLDVSMRRTAVCILDAMGKVVREVSVETTPAAIAGAAPAALEACGLSPRRSIAMVKVAREVASGRVDPADPAGDKRLLAIPEIGPWTIACLALRGRGEPDALLADLGRMGNTSTKAGAP